MEGSLLAVVFMVKKQVAKITMFKTYIVLYRVTAVSANILYLDSLGTEGVNLRGCVFYMKM